MSARSLNNVNIQSITLIPTPREIRQQYPQTPSTRRTVAHGRETIEKILDGEDPRLLAIVGPCSIHDVQAGLDYARRLHALATELQETLVLVMRVYFEKPRTALGWKGLINDPFMDDTFRIDEGLRIARRFLLQLAELGLPAATEALEPHTPQYIGDLISWTAIGARTSESQTHREMASGLSTPVGFKNSMDGSIASAVNAVKSARQPHHFLGITELGRPAVFGTTGNPYPHVILRGGPRPNYDAEHIQICEAMLREAGLPVRIMVDCSHGNSAKDPARQAVVLRDILSQIERGNRSIFGFMLESFLEEGSQPLTADPTSLRYGVSITDPCLGWKATEALLRETHVRYRPCLEARRVPAARPKATR